MTEGEPTGLADAVQADLKEWGVADSALATAALDLAMRLADPKVRPAAAAMLHRELRETLVRARAAAPEKPANDEVDELKRRRSERRGA